MAPRGKPPAEGFGTFALFFKNTRQKCFVQAIVAVLPTMPPDSRCSVHSRIVHPFFESSHRKWDAIIFYNSFHTSIEIDATQAGLFEGQELLEKISASCSSDCYSAESKSVARRTSGDSKVKLNFSTYMWPVALGYKDLLRQDRQASAFG